MTFTAFEIERQRPGRNDVLTELSRLSPQLSEKFANGYYERAFGYTAQSPPDGRLSAPADWARAYALHHEALEEGALIAYKSQKFLRMDAPSVYVAAADLTGLTMAGVAIDITPAYEAFVTRHTNRLPLHSCLPKSAAETAMMDALFTAVRRAAVSIDDILGHAVDYDDFAIRLLAATRQWTLRCSPPRDEDIDYWAAVADWSGDETGLLAVKLAEQDMTLADIRDMHVQGIHPEYALSVASC